MNCKLLLSFTFIGVVIAQRRQDNPAMPGMPGIPIGQGGPGWLGDQGGQGGRGGQGGQWSSEEQGDPGCMASPQGTERDNLLRTFNDYMESRRSELGMTSYTRLENPQGEIYRAMGKHMKNQNIPRERKMQVFCDLGTQTGMIMNNALNQERVRNDINALPIQQDYKQALLDSIQNCSNEIQQNSCNFGKFYDCISDGCENTMERQMPMNG